MHDNFKADNRQTTDRQCGHQASTLAHQAVQACQPSVLLSNLS